MNFSFLNYFHTIHKNKTKNPAIEYTNKYSLAIRQLIILFIIWRTLDLMFTVDLSWKASNYISYTHSGELNNVVCVQFSIFLSTNELGQQEHLLNRNPQMDTLNVSTKLDVVFCVTSIEVFVWTIWKTLILIVQNYRSIIHAAVWASILLPLIYISLQFSLRNKTLHIILSPVLPCDTDQVFPWSANDFMVRSLSFCIIIVVTYWMFRKIMSRGC